MALLTSRTGYALAVVYLAIACFAVRTDVIHTVGSWIKLSGMGTYLVTLPSQRTLGLLLEAAGVPKVNYDQPGFSGYAQLMAHVLLTAALVYLLGFGIASGIRRLLQLMGVA